MTRRAFLALGAWGAVWAALAGGVFGRRPFPHKPHPTPTPTLLPTPTPAPTLRPAPVLRAIAGNTVADLSWT